MSNVLCLTLRFLDPVPQFHGREGDGEPEWPPSPLRLFQALVAAAGSRWHDPSFRDKAIPALEWLEQIRPSLIAPQTATGSFGYRMYVPNNSGDLMTAAWARGDTETDMSKFRVEKDVRPLNLKGDTIRYLFPLSNNLCPHFDLLQSVSRSVTHLGWGIDMVAGNAEILTEAQVAELEGDVWRPASDTRGASLRVPVSGTLNALIAKHEMFLDRLVASSFKPVSPLSTFQVIGYRHATEPAARQIAAFSILKPDASGMKSFDTPRRTRDVAGMVRHAIALAARDQGWSEERINVFIHGKTTDGSQPPSGPTSPDRFQYLPLPTINHGMGRRVESIRRVLIAAPPHCGQQTSWARRAMAGAELSYNNETAALLTILPGSDWVLKQYVDESQTWMTVTPVILPGFDDPNNLRRKLKGTRDPETQQRYLARLDSRIEELLRKSFRQAGFPNELMNNSELSWGEVGFHTGVDVASRYLPPENVANARRLHVCVKFPNAIRGPIAVGSGRFRGFGLFVKADD